MVFSRGLVISLGVSALSATLLFLYFRNRMASVERKVDVMFDLIQSHEADRQQVAHQMMMHQENSAPRSQNTGAWVTQENSQQERNLIDVSEDEDEEDEEYDSEDSREVSDNEDDLEERIKLVTTDIDLVEADEAKSVVVLETNHDEPVNVDDTVELQEVTDDLEEEQGSSADVENTVQSADKSDNDNDVDDSLEEDDSDEEEDNSDETTQVVSEEIEYNKLKVAELKAIAEAKGLSNYKSLKKQPLIDLIKASE